MCVCGSIEERDHPESTRFGWKNRRVYILFNPLCAHYIPPVKRAACNHAYIALRALEIGCTRARINRWWRKVDIYVCALSTLKRPNWRIFLSFGKSPSSLLRENLRSLSLSSFLVWRSLPVSAFRCLYARACVCVSIEMRRRAFDRHFLFYKSRIPITDSF